jgi:hypothetical protein
MIRSLSLSAAALAAALSPAKPLAIVAGVAMAALLVALLLPLLPLFPVRSPAAVRVKPAMAGQTVASLRALARRRGIRSIAGVPVASCRRAALLSALG